MSEVEEYTKEEEYYNDWYNDNESFLLDEFAGMHDEMYNEFCREMFKDYKEGL